MKNQIELINYYNKDLNKTIAHHGTDNEYFNYSFFLLQAAKMGISQKNMFDWAQSKCDELHKEALDLL